MTNSVNQLVSWILDSDQLGNQIKSVERREMPLKEDPLRAVYFGTMDNPFDLETARTVEETDKMFGEKEILGEQK